jgi:RNA polymerase sigma factor (sigma-70 family)
MTLSNQRKAYGISLQKLCGNNGLSINQNVCTFLDFKSEATNLKRNDSGQETKQKNFSRKADLVLEAVRSFNAIAKPSELEDLLQDGFLYLWELTQAGGFYDSDKLLGEIKNYLRGQRTNQNSLYRLAEKLEKFGVASSQMPEKTEAERALMRQCINRALNKLKPKQREAIALYYGLYGSPMKVTDIAAIQQQTPRAVRKQCQRGRAALAEDPEIHSLAS